MIRIGHAWDIHRLVSGRKLILGGIEINYELGLLGHSDADVLLHAISEAILGALALGDLGTFFPDNDFKNKDLDSKIILKHCLLEMTKRGYQIINLDSTIFAEQPKLRPHIDSMRHSVANLVKTGIENISIKATTHEKLGPIGQGQAIAAEVVILIEKIAHIINL